MSQALTVPGAASRSLFRVSRADAAVAGLGVALVVPVALMAVVAPRMGAFGLALAAAVVALGTVWASNTLAHIQLHTPIFRSRALNRAFCLWLTAVLLIPQTVWKHRHLAHHAGVSPKPMRWSRALLVEIVVVVAAFAALVAVAPTYTLFAHVPGVLLGLSLCQASGVFEHRHAGEDVDEGVSTYGSLYNFVWLNDGFHREHHVAPGAHWTTLPRRRAAPGPTSARAPLLRWVDEPWIPRALGWLERVVLVQPALARWVVDVHARATAPLIASLPCPPARVAIVGGGLFPRSVRVLQRLLPDARLTVIDRSSDSLARAQAALGDDARDITFIEGSFDPQTHASFDLVVLPLALVASGDELGARCPLLVHAWLTRELDGPSRVVSWLLWKKVSLVGGACG